MDAKINYLNEEQLEKELNEEFLKRQPLVENGLKIEAEMEKGRSSDESSGNRGNNNNDDNYFNLSLNPQNAKERINMDNYIKIKGNEINPAKFMNKFII